MITIATTYIFNAKNKGNYGVCICSLKLEEICWFSIYRNFEPDSIGRIGSMCAPRQVIWKESFENGSVNEYFMKWSFPIWRHSEWQTAEITFLLIMWDVPGSNPADSKNYMFFIRVQYVEKFRYFLNFWCYVLPQKHFRKKMKNLYLSPIPKTIY